MIHGHLLFEFEFPPMGTLITCLFICSYLEEVRERDFYQLLSSAVPKDMVRTDLKRKHIGQLKQLPNSPCCAPHSDVNWHSYPWVESRACPLRHSLHKHSRVWCQNSWCHTLRTGHQRTWILDCLLWSFLVIHLHNLCNSGVSSFLSHWVVIEVSVDCVNAHEIF